MSTIDLSEQVRNIKPGETMFMTKNEFTPDFQDKIMGRHFGQFDRKPAPPVQNETPDAHSLTNEEWDKYQAYKDRPFNVTEDMRQQIFGTTPNEAPQRESQPVQPPTQPEPTPNAQTTETPANDWLNDVFTEKTPTQPVTPTEPARTNLPEENPVNEKPAQHEMVKQYQSDVISAAHKHGLNPRALNEFAHTFSVDDIAQILVEVNKNLNKPTTETPQVAPPNLAEQQAATGVKTYKGIGHGLPQSNSTFDFYGR